MLLKNRRFIIGKPSISRSTITLLMIIMIWTFSILLYTENIMAMESEPGPEPKPKSKSILHRSRPGKIQTSPTTESLHDPPQHAPKYLIAHEPTSPAHIDTDTIKGKDHSSTSARRSPRKKHTGKDKERLKEQKSETGVEDKMESWLKESGYQKAFPHKILSGFYAFVSLSNQLKKQKWTDVELDILYCRSLDLLKYYEYLENSDGEQGNRLLQFIGGIANLRKIQYGISDYNNEPPSDAMELLEQIIDNCPNFFIAIEAHYSLARFYIYKHTYQNIKDEQDLKKIQKDLKRIGDLKGCEWVTTILGEFQVVNKEESFLRRHSLIQSFLIFQPCIDALILHETRKVHGVITMCELKLLFSAFSEANYIVSKYFLPGLESIQIITENNVEKALKALIALKDKPVEARSKSIRATEPEPSYVKEVIVMEESDELEEDLEKDKDKEKDEKSKGKSEKDIESRIVKEEEREKQEEIKQDGTYVFPKFKGKFHAKLMTTPSRKLASEAPPSSTTLSTLRPEGRDHEGRLSVTIGNLLTQSSEIVEQAKISVERASQYISSNPMVSRFLGLSSGRPIINESS